MTRRLLIVEDDAAQRELLCTLLEEHGYSCTGVEDGRRALQVLSEDEAPDVVLLDMVLPRLNGHEFLRELRARGEHRLGVIVVSGYGPVSRFSERLPLVRAVVQKPVDVRALLAAVESCVPPAPLDARG